MLTPTQRDDKTDAKAWWWRPAKQIETHLRRAAATARTCRAASGRAGLQRSSPCIAARNNDITAIQLVIEVLDALRRRPARLAMLLRCSESVAAPWRCRRDAFTSGAIDEKAEKASWPTLSGTVALRLASTGPETRAARRHRAVAAGRRRGLRRRTRRDRPSSSCLWSAPGDGTVVTSFFADPAPRSVSGRIKSAGRRDTWLACWRNTRAATSCRSNCGRRAVQGRRRLVTAVGLSVLCLIAAAHPLDGIAPTACRWRRARLFRGTSPHQIFRAVLPLPSKGCQRSIIFAASFSYYAPAPRTLPSVRRGLAGSAEENKQRERPSGQPRRTR